MKMAHSATRSRRLITVLSALALASCDRLSLRSKTQEQIVTVEASAVLSSSIFHAGPPVGVGQIAGFQATPTTRNDGGIILPPGDGGNGGDGGSVAGTN